MRMNRGFMKRWAVFLVLIVGSAFLLGGCGSSGDGGGGGGGGDTGEKVTITGTVSDKASVSNFSVGGSSTKAYVLPKRSNGKLAKSAMVDKASVRVFGKGASFDVLTDSGGYFSVSDVPVSDDGRILIRIEKKGHAVYEEWKSVKKDGEAINIYAVVPVKVQETVSSDGSVSIKGPSLGLSLDLGTSFSGAEVEAYVGDPTDETGAIVFPGDYMAVTSDDTSTALQSIAFMEVTVSKDGKLVSDFEDPVEVKIELPKGYQSGDIKNPHTGEKYKHGDKIEWWSYSSDIGQWVQEDASPDKGSDMDMADILDVGGSLYSRAWIKHLSWWNADYPQEFAYIDVQVVDGAGSAMSGVPVYSRGYTYTNTSSPVYTDSDGWAKKVLVKRSNVIKESAEIFARFGSVEIRYTDLAPGEGEVVSSDSIPVVYCPEDESSKVLKNNIVVDKDASVSGKVVYIGTSKAVSGVKIYSSLGGAVVTSGSDGSFSLPGFKGIEMALFTDRGSEIEHVTPPAEDVVIEVPNSAPTELSIAASPEGKVSNGTNVTLTASAKDPDGDAMEYKWVVDKGSLNVSAGESVVWTAPASGTGAVRVTLTVTDSIGKSSEITLTIPYGGVVGGTSYFLTIYDEDTGNPVSGAIVVLHGVDGSVEETILSDVDGSVNFGDIGRTKADFTVAVSSDRTVSSYYGDVDRVYRGLNSISAVPGGTHSVNVDMDGSFYDYQGPTSPDAILSVAVRNYDATKPTEIYVNGYGQRDDEDVYPLSSFSTGFYDSDLVSGDTVSNDVSVRNADLVHAVAIGMNREGDSSSVTGYDYKLDQVPISGDQWVFEPVKTASTLNWVADSPIWVPTIYGTRKGVTINLFPIGYEHGDGENQLGSGPYPQDLALSMDKWTLMAWDSTTQGSIFTEVSSLNRLPSCPLGSVNVNVPDYVFTEISSDDNSFSWDIDGEYVSDSTNIELNIVATSGDYLRKTESEVSWVVILPADRTSWTEPALPDVLEGWLAEADDWQESFNISINKLEGVGGYEQALELLLSGIDPWGRASEVYSGEGRMSEMFMSSLQKEGVENEGVDSKNIFQRSLQPAMRRFFFSR